MKKLFATCLVLATQAFVPVMAENFVDIAIACTPRTSADSKNELRLKSDDGQNECVSQDAYLRNVSIKEGQLRYSEGLDLYMLFLFVKPSDKSRLGVFTSNHVNSRMFIVKNGVIEVSGWLAAPMVNGYINIGVPSEESGRSVMDKLIPPRGKGKEHAG
ncbi:hypothetical protein ACFWZU_04265 [Frateuria sp. GZRR33]|uniref:hypothetical protein n=1 Tax=Frateuria sp. GZRR33 TaxID=3351535 RepID=UPI003EDBA2F9